MRLPAAFIVAALAGQASAQTTVYGISRAFSSAADNRIYQINAANADLTNMVQVTLAGHTVDRALTLAVNPLDNSLWAVLQTTPVGGGSGRRLATINPATGVATLVGDLSDQVSCLAFRSNGTLYGVTGDGAATPETLYTINTATAAATLAFPLGNGADGETIAFGSTGLLYHSSGNSTALFESINVDTQVITPLGSASGEMFAMGLHTGLGAMFGTDIDSDLFTINLATGARTFIGTMADQLGLSTNRGFAVVSASVCYPNCDNSTTAPVLNVQDFTCFLQRYAAGESYANCDNSTVQPVLNVQDFTCFLQSYAAGCP
jgi:hypothetical protein